VNAALSAGDSLIQTETVQSDVACGKLGMITLSPHSSRRPPPKRPGTQVPPVSCPSRLLPLRSATVVPLWSSNDQCATRSRRKLSGAIVTTSMEVEPQPARQTTSSERSSLTAASPA
jgi:hypothetical protein